MIDNGNGNDAAGKRAEEIAEDFKDAVGHVAHDAEKEELKVECDFANACINGDAGKCVMEVRPDSCADDGGIPCKDEDGSCAEEERKEDAEDEDFDIGGEDAHEGIRDHIPADCVAGERDNLRIDSFDGFKLDTKEVLC